MNLRITSCMLALLAGAAGAENTDISVALSPAIEQDPDHVPYRTVEMIVDNGSSATVHSITLSESRGGADLQVELTVPPKSKQTVRIALPAAAVHQDYTAAVVASEGTSAGKIADVACAIEWPAEDVNPHVLIDPVVCRSWEEELLVWPGRVVRSTFLIALVASLALAGTLLVRRPVIRTTALLLLLVAASAAIWGYLDEEPTVVIDDAGEQYLAVRCLRSADWVRIEGPVGPVYSSAAQMQADRTVLLAGADGGAFVWIRPDQVLLFRRLGEAHRSGRIPE